jgi:hypothetical protein
MLRPTRNVLSDIICYPLASFPLIPTIDEVFPFVKSCEVFLHAVGDGHRQKCRFSGVTSSRCRVPPPHRTRRGTETASNHYNRQNHLYIYWRHEAVAQAVANYEIVSEPWTGQARRPGTNCVTLLRSSRIRAGWRSRSLMLIPVLCEIHASGSRDDATTRELAVSYVAKLLIMRDNAAL